MVMVWDWPESRWCPALILDLDPDEDEITLDVDYQSEDGYESVEALSSYDPRTDDDGLVWLARRRV